MQEKEESNQRKRARMQEPVTVLEDYDDDDEDEDMEKPPDSEKKEDLSELEMTIFQHINTLENVAELVITSMVFTFYFCIVSNMNENVAFCNNVPRHVN